MIERVHAPSREEFEQVHLQSRKPLIITGVVDKWPAVERWKDLDYLEKTMGSRQIPVERGDYFARVTDVAHERNAMPANEYVRAVRDGTTKNEKLYVSDVPVSVIPELLPDLGTFPYCDNTEYELQNYSRVLFFGRDTFTWPHHHANNMSVLCQLVGKKRMILYSPDQSAKLYPYSLWQWIRNGENPMASQVDVLKPDFTRFPNFKDVKAIDFEVHPGEMVVIPVHWWHAVESPGISMAVTWNFQPPLNVWHFPNPGLLSLAVMGYHSVTRMLRPAGKPLS